MATINTFKEIKSWQFAKDIAVDCYKITREENFRREYALVDQIRRSAVSVSSNIAEGFERKGNREFIQFLFIAAGSLGELQSQLIITSEIGLLNPEKLVSLEARIEATRKTIYGMVVYLKSSEQKGYKFSEPEAVYAVNAKANQATANEGELPQELRNEAANVWENYKKTYTDAVYLEALELDAEFVQRLN
jgi:four helix bundle protein